MSSVNVIHRFPLRAPLSFPLRLKLLTILYVTFFFFFFFSFTNALTHKILSCVSYLSISKGEGKEGREGEVERKNLAFQYMTLEIRGTALKEANNIKWKLMLQNSVDYFFSSICRFYLGLAMQHPKE